MLRRQFLKLLGALPLAALFGLRIPESESEIWLSNGGSPGSDPESMAAYVRRKWGLDEPKTFFVAPLGKDTNDGLALLRPKRTIAAAVEAMDDGDTVFVFPGIYEENKQIKIRGQFYMAHSIVYLGEKGVLDLAQSSEYCVVNNYIVRR